MEQAHSTVRAGHIQRDAETMSLPASYLLSMPVRTRELLPRLASVSLSWGDRTRERQVLVSILTQQLHGLLNADYEETTKVKIKKNITL